MTKLNKLILVFLLTISSLLSQDSDSNTASISSAVGFGSNGMVYRNYHDNGYVEYSGILLYETGLSDSRLDILAGLNIGEYLYLSYNEDLDFSVKYIYGAFGQYNDSSSAFSPFGNSNVAAHIMLGVELISPRQEGFSIEFMMGQAIKYDADSRIRIATTGGVQFMLNY